MPQRKSSQEMPIAITLLSIGLKLWVGLCFLIVLSFALMSRAQWMTSGYISGRRGGEVISPEESPIRIIIFGVLVLGILSYILLKGLKQRSYWSRWLVFIHAALIAILLLGLRSPQLLAPICGPFAVLALFIAFHPSSLSYFSNKDVGNFHQSFSVYLKIASMLLLIGGILFYVVIGLLAQKRMTALCKKFPLGSFSSSFIQASFEAGADRISFWDDSRKTSGSAWIEKASTAEKLDLLEKYQSMENGNAYATYPNFAFGRISCDIKFQNKKVIQNSFLNMD